MEICPRCGISHHNAEEQLNAQIIQLSGVLDPDAVSYELNADSRYQSNHEIAVYLKTKDYDNTSIVSWIGLCEKYCSNLALIEGQAQKKQHLAILLRALRVNQCENYAVDWTRSRCIDWAGMSIESIERPWLEPDTAALWELSHLDILGALDTPASEVALTLLHPIARWLLVDRSYFEWMATRAQYYPERVTDAKQDLAVIASYAQDRATFAFNLLEGWRRKNAAKKIRRWLLDISRCQQCRRPGASVLRERLWKPDGPMAKRAFARGDQELTQQGRTPELCR